MPFAAQIARQHLVHLLEGRYVPDGRCTFRIDLYTITIVGTFDAINSAIGCKIPYSQGYNLEVVLRIAKR